MHRFILHGSGPGRDWASFRFWRALGDAGKQAGGGYDGHGTINVLSVPFAGGLPKNDPETRPHVIEWWQRMAEDVAEQLAFINPDKGFRGVDASSDPKLFQRQLHQADIIYCHGGDTPTLVETFTELAPNYMEIINRRPRVLSGYSAGASCWGVCYYSNDWNLVLPGLRLLQAKIISHYESAAFPKLNRLAGEERALPMIAINNGEFVDIDAADPQFYEDKHYGRRPRGKETL